jgi:predicted nucleic acid-binding protein
MKIVSNSSPLIFFSAIGMMDTLADFGDISIPEAVYEEVTKNDLKGSNEVKHADWIKVVEVEDHESIIFSSTLDAGESEAIALAIKQNADLILMDDLAGRRAATAYGIEVIGTLGLLKVLYQKGRIENMKNVLDEIQKHGFWMSTDLYKKMLKD